LTVDVIGPSEYFDICVFVYNAFLIEI